MVRTLLADYESLVCLLRADRQTCVETFQDGATNDFLTGLMERHEKMTWMLRVFLRDFFDDESAWTDAGQALLPGHIHRRNYKSKGVAKTTELI
jgi:hypothetical protein